MRRTAVLFTIVALLSIGTTDAQSTHGCEPPDTGVIIDHVVVAVHDLEAATTSMADLGFTVKPSRLHPNGLVNGHVKFRDGTEIELMSVRGPARDDVARAYASFLQDGEGGAYLAFRGPQEEVVSMARDVGLKPTQWAASGFRYMTFSEPRLRGVFFVEHDSAVADNEATFVHANGADGIAEVWMERSTELEKLLNVLGASVCNEGRASGGTAAVYRVRGGLVVLVDAQPIRPRVLGVSVKTQATIDTAFVRSSLHGIWLDRTLIADDEERN